MKGRPPSPSSSSPPERRGQRDGGFRTRRGGLHHQAHLAAHPPGPREAHLENKLARDWIEDRNRALEEMVAERTRGLAATQDATILSMATLAETRDKETSNHIRRTHEDAAQGGSRAGRGTSLRPGGSGRLRRRRSPVPGDLGQLSGLRPHRARPGGADRAWCILQR